MDAACSAAVEGFLWKQQGLEVRKHLASIARRGIAPAIVNGTSIEIVNHYWQIIGVGTRDYEDRGVGKPDNDNNEDWDDDYDPYCDPRFDGFPNA